NAPGLFRRGRVVSRSCCSPIFTADSVTFPDAEAEPGNEGNHPETQMSLFGPVFYYDLVRQTRRALPTIVRLLYLLTLFFILGLAELTHSTHRSSALPAGGVARMVEEFCSIFLVLQFILVVVLT